MNKSKYKAPSRKPKCIQTGAVVVAVVVVGVTEEEGLAAFAAFNSLLWASYVYSMGAKQVNMDRVL